jgi:(2Fe-2S) ferredoxin
MTPDALLFVISQYNLSARKFGQLSASLAAACPLPSALVRLEGNGPNLPDALDALRDAGRRTILVQPVGIPFTESLFAWLPGAMAHWLQQDGNGEISLALGKDLAGLQPVIGSAVEAALAGADDAAPVNGAKPSLGKPGWQTPPDFAHHLLVCTGPRCHFRDTASLLHTLKDETARQGIASECLTARTGCLFPCNQGPVVALYPKGEWYRLPDSEAVTRFVSQVLVAGKTLPDLLVHTAKSTRIAPPKTEVTLP